MTTYNRPEALAEVFSGLCQQTLHPHEVLIADDGSGPATATLVKKLPVQAPFRVEHVWHADQGFRAATIRNKAIRRSTGDYLVLLDGDCIPDKHFIADHRQLAQQGFFYQGKRTLIEERRTPVFKFADTATAARKVRLFFSSGIGNRHHLVRLPFFPASVSRRLSGVRSCNMGLFKDDLVAVNGFNEQFVGWGREDSELAVRLFNYGLKRKSHPFLAVCYHLWHVENDRKRLPLNDELLKQVIESGKSVCPKGLVNMDELDL